MKSCYEYNIIANQFRSILLNKDQCRLLLDPVLIDPHRLPLIFIESNWSLLIGGDLYWATFWINSGKWSLLICIGDWSGMSCYLYRLEQKSEKIIHISEFIRALLYKVCNVVSNLEEFDVFQNSDLILINVFRMCKISPF